MTTVVAWLALMLAAGHWIYTLYWGFWLGSRVKEIKAEEAPTPEVLELRSQALAQLAGEEDGWKSDKCARCGHPEGIHHPKEGCIFCPPARRCAHFVPRRVV